MAEGDANDQSAPVAGGQAAAAAVEPAHPSAINTQVQPASPLDLQEPLEVGARVLCVAAFDNCRHAAEVIDREVVEIDGREEYTYYIHYVDFDKRLDEWVTSDKLSLFDGALPVDPLSPRVNTALGLDADQKLTRRLKRKYDEIHHVTPGVEELAPIDQDLERQHQEKTKVKNIQTIELGKFEVDTWYYSPYPEPYASCRKLYVCEFSLKYFHKKKTLLRHLARLEVRNPPGNEIYRSPLATDGNADNPAAASPQISVFEVDGRRAKVYCQNLCLLSKLFLDHKTLYYDVDPFLFYVVCERDSEGCHIVGYFSKEKCSAEGYNLACILTLPCYQRKGYGRFMIHFSYELSRREGKMGTPERPLSDLGQVSYRSYWMRILLDALQKHKGNLSIRDLSQETYIKPEDVIKTLESLNLIKYWKGDHIICFSAKVVEEHLKAIQHQQHLEIDPKRLHWTQQGGASVAKVK